VTDQATDTAGRRELNKARTRERLLEALRAQLTQGGLETMTVEVVAEAAGVSRRTFFNYFPSLEAALAEGMSVPIDGMAQAFLARPLTEAPLLAIQRALQDAPLPMELLRWVRAVKCSGADRHTVAVNVWAYHQNWLQELLRQRQPEAEDLAVTTLAGAVMAIFEAAESTWMQDADTDVSQASVDHFNELLRRGLGYAQNGWGSLTQQPAPTTPASTT
jgi:AcrR family transcriptional regulator